MWQATLGSVPRRSSHWLRMSCRWNKLATLCPACWVPPYYIMWMWDMDGRHESLVGHQEVHLCPCLDECLVVAISYVVDSQVESCGTQNVCHVPLMYCSLSSSLPLPVPELPWTAPPVVPPLATTDVDGVGVSCDVYCLGDLSWLHSFGHSLGFTALASCANF